MGFWIFMLIMDLLIPFTMIGYGRHFMKKAPKEINDVYGYRTTMSRKNKETWVFAHKYFGKIWYACGLVMLPITIVCMLLVIGRNDDYVGTVGGIVCIVQMIPLIGATFPTEAALKKNFDKNGKRRQLPICRIDTKNKIYPHKASRCRNTPQRLLLFSLAPEFHPGELNQRGLLKQAF